jgi:hypothetical protein
MNSVISSNSREQLHAQLDRLLNELPSHLNDAPLAEESLRRGMRSVARQALQFWSDDTCKSDGGPSCQECGAALRHRGCPRLKLDTSLGAIQVSRPRRCCEACRTNMYPHDKAIRFGEHGVSWRLARLACRYVAGHTFEESKSLLEEDYGVLLSKETLERIVQRAGEIVLQQDDAHRQAFFLSPPREQKEKLAGLEAQPDLMSISVDGTMMHAEKEWREIRVGRVMSYDGQGQRIAQKSFARFLSVEEIGQQVFLNAHQLGYAHARQRVFLGDGAKWIWELASDFFPEAIEILDWYHVSEKVHEAANVVYRDDEATDWAKQIKSYLWEGQLREARAAIDALRKILRSQARREALRVLNGYLKNNAGRMNYSAYREAKLPIGSGMIESHCKKVVKQRCKNSGMRNWRKRQAECVLRFRTATIDNTFDELWANKLKIAA